MSKTTPDTFGARHSSFKSRSHAGRVTYVHKLAGELEGGGLEA